MHVDEIKTDAALVQRLLAAQFPEWSALPIVPVDSSGTDNAMYRLGDALAVRLPRIHWAVGQIAAEQRWLPRLAPHLPLAISETVAVGEPGESYPYPWAVNRWLPGEIATLDRISDIKEFARDLAHAITRLQAIDTAEAVASGGFGTGRGGLLTRRDTETLAAIAELGDAIDAEAVIAAWHADVDAQTWDRPPVWIHGDLQPTNLLVREGKLSALIDFGCLEVGDPAVDLIPAWNLLPPDARDTFRAALGVDDATWARGRGWALSIALIALPYYKDTNPVLAASSQHVIAQVLADRASRA